MPKEFKTYIEQIELLKAKGLIIPNEALALYALKNYGYFNVIKLFHNYLLITTYYLRKLNWHKIFVPDSTITL